jgi:hypothetical protein
MARSSRNAKPMLSQIPPRTKSLVEELPPFGLPDLLSTTLPRSNLHGPNGAAKATVAC